MARNRSYSLARSQDAYDRFADAVEQLRVTRPLRGGRTA
jgi:hypothetical protein